MVDKMVVECTILSSSMLVKDKALVQWDRVCIKDSATEAWSVVLIKLYFNNHLCYNNFPAKNVDEPLVDCVGIGSGVFVIDLFTIFIQEVQLTYICVYRLLQKFRVKIHSNAIKCQVIIVSSKITLAIEKHGI